MNPCRAYVSLGILGLALAPAPARAMGAVVGKQGESVHVVGARLAVTATEGRTTRWGQVSVEGASAGFVWLLPVGAGARLDLASDAWLDALDAATSEVILPPTSPAPCPQVSLDPQYVAPATAPGSRPPSEVMVLSDLASLEGFVAGAGYEIPATLTTPLDATFAAGGYVAALTYDGADLPTRAVRIVDGALASLPLAWTAMGMGMGMGTATTEAHVTAFVIGGGPAVAGSSLTLDPSTLLWGWSGSNYQDATRALLGNRDGWLRQAAMPGLLFSGAPAAPGARLPAIVTPYYLLAQSYDPAVSEAATCVLVAGTTALDSTPYPSLCPPGALAIGAGASVCTPEAGDGGADGPLDPLACKGADDAAFAFGGLTAEGAWVTRLERLVGLGRGADDPVRISGLTAVSPTVTASGYDAVCSPATGPINGGPASAAPSSPPDDTSTGDDGSGAAAAAAGCGLALDACNASSDSSDGSSGGCDSSNDGSSGGCGSGSGSNDGSTSSGGCGSDSGSSCTTTRRARGHSRSPVSRLVMLAMAVAAIARRRARPTARPCSPGTGA